MKYIKFSILFLFLTLFISCHDENPVIPDGLPANTGDYLDSTIIHNLITKIEEGDYGEIHSLLIYKDEALVVEKYFRGYNRDRLHVCYSVTKSFTSALIGIAIDQGLINGTNQNLLGFFPEYDIIQNPSAWKNNITLHHVLSMSAGFEWDEWSLPYTHPDNDVRRLLRSSDWIKFVLDLPVITPPGTYFTYNSGCSTLLGGIILKAAGVNARTFGFNNLLSKLDIGSYSWDQGPNNITDTFGGLSLRPIDMLKFGRVYLQNGNWNGVQIISESWVNNSTIAKIDINPYYEYAYQWWRYKNASTTGQALRVNDVFYANGWGGQLIWVVPHLHMVAVSTGGNFESGDEPLYIFRDYILPAAYNAD